MPTSTKTFINPVVTLKEFPFNGKQELHQNKPNYDLIIKVKIMIEEYVHKP